MTGAVITASGMTTAIGLTSAASCAAFRARLDNFRETRFISHTGDWILGAEVPLAEAWRGTRRWVEMLMGPVRECMEQADAPFSEIPVLLCLPDEAQPGRFSGLEAALWAGLEAAFGAPQRSSRSYAFGSVGGAVALRDACEMLEEGAPGVIVAGVDSYLSASVLSALDREDRLLTAANSNGFIAGEAGAAVLVSGTGGGVSCAGIGFGFEDAGINAEDKPHRAEGMVKAMRAALTGAGITYEEISYRIADLAGEHFYFREAALAQARLWRGARDPEEIWHPADGMGATGAATLPICLGIALTSARKGYAPGPVALIHAAHDDGRRAAVVTREAA